MLAWCYVRIDSQTLTFTFVMFEIVVPLCPMRVPYRTDDIDFV